MPLIHTWFTYSKWNMGEICGLKFHLSYGQLKKTESFKIAKSQKNFTKISHIGPWVKGRLSLFHHSIDI